MTCVYQKKVVPLQRQIKNVRLMKKSMIILVALASMCLTSCMNEYLPDEFRMKSFDRTVDEMLMVFEDTKYSGVLDSEIISVDTIRHYSNGGILEAVSYKYGENTLLNFYYCDADGTKVRVKDNRRYRELNHGDVVVLKENGYPDSQSLMYDVSRDGKVRIDWILLVVAAALFYVVFKIFTV